MNRVLNPDSAVAIGQEVRGTILPQRSRWVCASEQRSLSGASRDCLSLIATSCESVKHFETSQSDAFAAPGSHLASGIFGSTAESGIKDRCEIKDRESGRCFY